MAVLLLGDSHLARLARYRRLLDADCTVRAVSGSTACDLLDQLDGLDPARFRVIAVSVGTNDCGSKPSSLTDFVQAIEALVDRVAPTQVLMVNNPGADARAVDYDDAKMRRYAEAAADVVRSAGGSVVDIPSAIRPMGRIARTPDGIHVSKIGHLLLIPTLRRALRRAGRHDGGGEPREGDRQR